jgi:hypothetical protein
MEKPWTLLDPTDRKNPWWIASNNIHRPKENIDNIICYLIIQDCNQAGSYRRVRKLRPPLWGGLFSRSTGYT